MVFSNKFNDDPIIVSGISGRFPKAKNVSEFAKNLYNCVDMTDTDESRWKHFHSEVPKRTGKVQNLEKFDASFFSILDKHANMMDPQCRCLLEHTYEAILDAGISPQSVIGSKTGVFIGCCFTDSEFSFKYNVPAKEGYGVFGNAAFYLSNRLSYALGLCGPSMTVDTACSSSAYALDCAYKSMMSGACDAAIVGGSQLVLDLTSTVEYKRLAILAPDGEYCRPFDEKACGFTRADTICVIFLQRKKDSKRIYAELLYTNSNNDGFKKEGSTFPSRIMQKQLIENFYKTIKIDPSLVEFIEAHSTGTRLGDPEEVAALDEVYCKNVKRTKPLALGSVKSNMGHAEASSGIVSITKILLTLDSRKIAPNINVTKIRSDIPAFAEKRIRVVTEHEDLKSPYISMNSFGLGGANVHGLFRGNLKEKINHGIPTDNLNRMVLWSGRTEEALNSIFDDITKRPLDGEFIALLQNSQCVTNPANMFRGYGIFKHDEMRNQAVCVESNIQHFNEEKRPIVFVYSGIGSQWPGMGASLMNIPIFANTINKCHDILLPKGINLRHVISQPDSALFKNVLNSYVGIVSIEIALTELLYALGVKPDFIIGHSVGEIGCAYGDGCFSLEETILTAYARGKASSESKTIDGAMAAVGLNFRDVEKDLPHSIDIACHNGADSTTVSGPVKDIQDYVAKLKNKNIFAREVESSGNALHSRYITEMGGNFYEILKNVIKTPKRRSEKWLSSCYPENQWKSNENSQFSSAEYHTQNLLKPVLFEEVTEMLPKNAITIEIAPHGLLKSILKRSLKDGIHISLTQRGNNDGVRVIMDALGNLFQKGVDMDISKLYPAIEFPVSRGTPMISPLLKWNHSENYFVPLFDTYNSYERRNVVINMSDKIFEFVQGHIIDGKTLFPGTGWLYLTWETFGMMHGIHHTKLKVVFDDVKFLRATSLVANQDIVVTCSIHRGSGRFEIIEGKSTIANGYLKIADNMKLTDITVEDKSDSILLEESDFYKEMRLRGYYHQGLFRAIKEIRDDGLSGKIKWNEEWVTFMDCLIQFQVLMKDTRMLILPTSVRKLLIDPILHRQVINSIKSGEVLLDVKSCPYMNISQAGGIEIHGFEGSLVNRRRPHSDPVLEAYKFIPYHCNMALSKRDIAKICVQIALENAPSKKLSSLEIDGGDDEFLSEDIYSALSEMPVITPEVNLVTLRAIESMENVSILNQQDISTFKNINIIIKSNAIGDKDFLSAAKSSLNENGFIVSIENQNSLINVDRNVFDVLASWILSDKRIFMIRYKKPVTNPSLTTFIKISENFNEWIEPLKKAIANDPSVVVYAENDEISGILGLINCIRKEPNGDKLRCVLINDSSAPPFNKNLDFYKSQLNLDLVVNIYESGNWGSYRHVKLINQLEECARSDHVFANCLVKGDLSTLCWLKGPLNSQTNKEIINISYASLNFRDVMLATGKINSDDVLNRIQQQCVFGFEFSGTLKNKRVMGLGPTGAMATKYDSNKTILWDVPDTWSLDEAASVPLVYFTVYFAFFRTVKIERGKSILIHSACGGVGLAAIQVALSNGLEVFATVSSDEKKKYLMETFPQLKLKNIGNSRDTSFEQMVKVNTQGKGVDYVLNSLSEEKLHASIRCLGFNGTFLEIGKFDIINKTKIDMGYLAKRINFKAVFFDDLSIDDEEFKITHKILDNDIKAGIVKPLKTNIYDASEMEQAFRFMASGKHIGKVLLKMRESPNDVESFPMEVIPRVYYTPDETVVIVGGLGGFGLELADWLVLRGCRKLVLSSSRGISNAYQAMRIKTWKSYGVNVVVSTANITQKSGCEKLFNDAIKMGPVGGIFNLAVALRDGIFDNQTIEMFEESLAPKAEATKHLDSLSQKMCPSLKYFVVFSSVSCGRGNAGQSNYGMANSVMEKICERRQKQGLPAKAIQFGAIGDVGLLAVLQEKDLNMEISGTLPQGINSCLEVFDTLLNYDSEPIVATMVVAEKHFDDTKKGNIIDAIMNIMSIRDPKQISMEASLSRLGMDSLMGVEIQQILERDYDIVLSSQDLRSISLNQLEKLVTSKSLPNISSDENVTEEIKKLLTSFGDEKTSSEVILKLNDKKLADKKVLIIPGFEGMTSDIWYQLASGIPYPTYMLQFGTNSHVSDFNDIFKNISQHVLNFYAKEKNFILIGHSFGCLMTLKIAKLLEDANKSGSVLFIDGSPKFIHELFTQLSQNNSSDEYLQDIIIQVCIKLLFRESAQEVLKKIFTENSTMESKLETFLVNAKEKSVYSIDYGRKMIDGLLKRFKIALNTDKIHFEKLMHSTITLIKPTEKTLLNIDDDFGLKEFVNGDIEIVTLEGNHASIIGNPKLVNYIR